MNESNDVKLRVLQELMEKMRDLDGDKLKPKAVEVSVSSMKPEIGIEGDDKGISDLSDLKPEDDILGDKPMDAIGEKKDDEDLSPEDLAILEHLFADKDPDQQ